MAFVVKVVFLAALVYGSNAGLLAGHHGDTFAASALNAPSASYGAPSNSYGPPALHAEISHAQIEHHQPIEHHQHIEHHQPIEHHQVNEIIDDHSHGAAILEASAHANGHADIITSGGGSYQSHSFSSGSGINDLSNGAILSGSAAALASGPGAIVSGPDSASVSVGAPRVIGTSVSVGRPDHSSTRYELASVVQNVVRRVPVEVTRHVKVAVPHAVPVPVPHEVKVPVPQPYPVHVDVVKKVPYPVYKTQHVEVERPVPYEVVKQVPFEVIRKVEIPVERPYEVIRHVHVPVEKHVEVPVAVWKPYPLHIIKHVTHYKKKSCCW